MPVYNASEYIEEAIESILNQTFVDFELCICDDGSTDSSYEICEKYGSIDPRVKIFRNNKNLGNLKTTNFLFSKCQSEYIAIQDADDISMVNRLELLINEFKKDPELTIVGSNFMVTDDKLNPISCSNLPTDSSEILKILEKEVPPILYGSILFKRDVLNKVGHFRSIFNRLGFADLDWLERVCERYKSKNSKDVSYYYRQNGLNKYPRKSILEFFGLQLIIEAHRQRLLGKNDFIDNKNYTAIRKFVATIYTKEAEEAFHQKEMKKSLNLFFKSFKVYPFNLYVVKNIVKIIVNKGK